MEKKALLADALLNYHELQLQYTSNGPAEIKRKFAEKAPEKIRWYPCTSHAGK